MDPALESDWFQPLSLLQCNTGFIKVFAFTCILYRYAGEASDDIDNLYSLDSFMEALNEVGGCTS